MATTIEPEPRSQPNIAIKVTEGLAIAIAPGLGYLLVFVYHLAFSEVLHIPTEFIEVQLRDLLIATVAVGLLLIISMTFADLTRGWLKVDRPGKRRVLRHTIAIVVFGIPLSLMALNKGGWALWLVPLVMLVMTSDILLPIWTKRHTKGFWNKMEADHNLRNTEKPILLQQLSERSGLPIIYMYIFLFALFYLSYTYGVLEAQTKVNYLILPKSHEVVLVIYGDKAIVSPYSGHEFSRTFRIVKLGDSSTDEFRVQPIGPINAESLG
jgi:hypothetical protein